MSDCYIVVVVDGMVESVEPFCGDECADTPNIEKQFINTVERLSKRSLTEDEKKAKCDNRYAEFECSAGIGSVQIFWEI